MAKKTNTFTMNLYGILFTYGIVRKRDQERFLHDFAKAIQENVADQSVGYAKQLMHDAYAAALHETDNWGEIRIKRIQDAVNKSLLELDVYAERETQENLRYGNFEEDGGTDIPIMKARVDAAVRPLYGDRFLPYDERYEKAQVSERRHDWDAMPGGGFGNERKS